MSQLKKSGNFPKSYINIKSSLDQWKTRLYRSLFVFHVLCKCNSKDNLLLRLFWQCGFAKDDFIFSAFSRLMRNYNNDIGL